jgi:hypothetical protein
MIAKVQPTKMRVSPGRPFAGKSASRIARPATTIAAKITLVGEGRDGCLSISLWPVLTINGPTSPYLSEHPSRIISTDGFMNRTSVAAVLFATALLVDCGGGGGSVPSSSAMPAIGSKTGIVPAQTSSSKATFTILNAMPMRANSAARRRENAL